MTLPLRYCKGFLIVFIFTSGVGNGLLKPVHRLRSVPTETVRQPYTDLFEISTDEIETSAYYLYNMHPDSVDAQQLLAYVNEVGIMIGARDRDASIPSGMEDGTTEDASGADS